MLDGQRIPSVLREQRSLPVRLADSGPDRNHAPAVADDGRERAQLGRDLIGHRDEVVRRWASPGPHLAAELELDVQVHREVAVRRGHWATRVRTTLPVLWPA